jgi:very-short-patch-repair endonuclease
MSSAEFNFHNDTRSFQSIDLNIGLPMISGTRSLASQYIVNSCHPVIQILHRPLPDEPSSKPQDANDAIQTAQDINSFLLAISSINFEQDDIDLGKLLEKLNRLKSDKFKYYKCAEIISPHLETLIKKNGVFNLSVMNLTLEHLEKFDFPNDQLKIILDLMNSSLMNSRIEHTLDTELDKITQCFKKLKALDPMLTKELIRNLFKLIQESKQQPRIINYLEILEGLEYNDTKEVDPILKYVLKKLKESNQLPKKVIGLVLNFLREKDPELYKSFISQKSNIIFNDFQDNQTGFFDIIVHFLSLPNKDTNNRVINTYIKKLEEFNSFYDLDITNCCRLIKYCRNKNQNQANRILLALSKILKIKTNEIKEPDKQIILRELNLLQFVNTHTVDLDVIRKLKTIFCDGELPKSPRNQTERRIEKILNEIKQESNIKLLPDRYFDGIEMDFLMLIGSGANARKINLEIDGKQHNRFYTRKTDELRDRYITNQGVEVIRLKLPQKMLNDAELKNMIIGLLKIQ